ncbi:MAG TPA: hypothetical protein VGN12_29590 [Pirellulales bacterium]|jgi:hypothetical protein
MTAVFFPKMFYGDQKSTRAAWGRVASRAIADRTWDNVFPALEMESIEALPAPLMILGKDKEFLRPKSIEWRIYCVSRLKDFVTASKRDSMDYDEREELTRNLLLQGMKELWFTVGVLGVGWGQGTDPIRPGRPDEQGAFWWQPALERYVYWLSDIQKISGRFIAHFEMPEDVTRISTSTWGMNIVHYARLLGYPLQRNEADHPMDVLANDYAGDISAYLLDYGVIEPDGEHFRLQPVPIT